MSNSAVTVKEQMEKGPNDGDDSLQYESIVSI